MRRGTALVCLLFVVLSVCSGTARGAEGPLVVVLPFTVHSEEALDYLRLEVPQRLLNRLRTEGIRVVDPALAERTLSLLSLPNYGVSAVLEAAGFLDAEFGMYGSISVLGEAVSVDATLVAGDESFPPFQMYAHGTGLAELPAMIEDVTQKTVFQVFGKQRVITLGVRGNERIEKEAILAQVKTEVGSLFSMSSTNEDIRAIYGMGFFEDVRVRRRQLAEGIEVIYEVRENPTVVEVQFVGLNKVKEKDARDAVNIRPYSVLNEYRIKEGEDSLTELYRKDGYLKVEISHTIEPVKDREVVVVIRVNEGEKIYIRGISFTGNNAFSDSRLKKQMDTSEKGILFWLFKTGKLEMPKLENDIENLSSFYQNQGYIRAKIGSPDIDIKDDGIHINIPIDEGPQYRFGEIKLEGEFVETEEVMYESLKCKSGDVYNRELVRQDVMILRELFNNKGYAYPDIEPFQDTDDTGLTVRLTYNLRKNNLIRFERINIHGNIKTRDKVIRRELEVYEQGLFSAEGLRTSTRNLHRLDFFENIDINTGLGSSQDTMILDVEVTEKKTGNLAVGAGFSSNEGIMASFEIQERNFLGYGQRMAFTGLLGGKSSQFSLDFTEPWLFDIPLATTASLYKMEREYDDFTKDSYGGSLQASYPIWKKWDLRAWGTYRYEDAEVTDVRENASLIIKDQEGRHSTSAITLGLRRDTRDTWFLTRDGSDNWVSVEYAGPPLGGSAGFVKYLANTSWYFPMFWDTSFFARGRIGYLQKIEGKELLLYEKFYLGGLNTIRGFQVRKVSPKDPITGDRIGGDKFTFLNLEYRFPLIKEAAVFGLVFFDAGNVYPEGESYDFTDLRRSIGGGIRWYSPMGPLRLEWGYNLSPEPDESSSVWDFTVGYGF